jgi:hypothetical protein
VSLIHDHERRPPAQTYEFGLAGQAVPVQLLEPSDQEPAANLIQLDTVGPEVTE